MKRRDEKDIPQERDRHLDVPAEANRDKHVNFVKLEEREENTERRSSDSPFNIPTHTPRPDGTPEGGHRA